MTARPLPYGDPAHQAAHQFLVESAVLLFRSRGDTREADLVSAGRADLLRETGAAR